MPDTCSQLRPGHWVRHPKFGVGEVLETEISELAPEDARALIRFEIGGRKWMALHVAKLTVLQTTDVAEQRQAATPGALAAQAETNAQKLVSNRQQAAPCLTEKAESVSLHQLPLPLVKARPESILFDAPTPVQLEAIKSHVWRQTIANPYKREKLQYRLENGERITPLITSLPLPWTSHAVLCLPESEAANMLGYRRACAGRGRPTIHTPRSIVASLPPYKKLRSVLYDMVQGLIGAGEVVAQDIKAHASRLNGSHDRYVELLDTIENPAFRDGTNMLITVMRRRAMSGIQVLRAKAHANGRWWPAPESIQVVLKADGSVVARMRFTEMYQPLKRSWIEWSSHAITATASACLVVEQLKVPKLVMPWGTPARAALAMQPVVPPWKPAPVLVGPFHPTWVSLGRHAEANLRKHRRHARQLQALPLQCVSFICSAVPPFKQLRNVLGNMAYDLTQYCKYDFFDNYIRASVVNHK